MRYVLLASIASLLVSASEVPPPPELPRYRLETGRILMYEIRVPGQPDRESRFEIHVLARNQDKSFRLLFRSESGGRTTLAFADAFPDGRLVSNDTLGVVLDPRPVFPKLPANQSELEDGWEVVEPNLGTVYRYRAVAERRGYRLSWTRHRTIDAIYGTTSEADAFFDPSRRRRVLTRIETKGSRGGESLPRSEAELVRSRWRSVDEAERLHREAEAYFAALAEYDETTRDLPFAPADELPQRLQDAEAKLRELENRLTFDILRESLRARLPKGPSSARLVESARRAIEIGSLLGAPAPEFEATDLEGERHSLSDYRGRVVLLDFWQANCGWCFYAMPKIRQLAETFRNEPVTVLGMNVDDDRIQDAHRIVSAMKLEYPNLVAKGTREPYRLRALPTLFLIDREGIVRHIHQGFSPGLADDLSHRIRALLEPAR